MTTTEQKPLTATQHRAADLCGRNWTYEDVAFEVGKSSKTISRWLKIPEFAAEVKKSRDKLLDSVPTAKSVLESALHATKENGEPDWPIRVKAAVTLMTSADPTPPDPADDRPPTLIYIAPDDDD